MTSNAVGYFPPRLFSVTCVIHTVAACQECRALGFGERLSATGLSLKFVGNFPEG